MTIVSYIRCRRCFMSSGGVEVGADRGGRLFRSLWKPGGSCSIISTEVAIDTWRPADRVGESIDFQRMLLIHSLNVNIALPSARGRRLLFELAGEALQQDAKSTVRWLSTATGWNPIILVD